MKPKKSIRHRSAVTGRFISAKKAAKHPRTTVAEHYVPKKKLK